MKRLVVTGIPCSPKIWESFLGKRKDQHILPIYEVLNQSKSADPRELSQTVAKAILEHQPESLIAHGFGVPFTILALNRLARRGELPKKMRLTFFNGAFRSFDVFHARHPLRFQFSPLMRLLREARKQGAVVDMRLRPFVPQIRSLYRQVTLFSFTEKVGKLLGLSSLIQPPVKFAWHFPTQIIASGNDPYIPMTSIEQLKQDLRAERLIQVDYHHFPYTLPAKDILPHIESFEGA